MAKSGPKTGTAKKDKPKSSALGQKQTSDEQSSTAQRRSKTALEQQCLDIFRDAFKPDANDDKTLQEVKSHLYKRDFQSAFSKEEYLGVYAARWSSSRALAYLKIFGDVAQHFRKDERGDQIGHADSPFRVACLGGGAGSELVAFAAWFNGITKNVTPSVRFNELAIDLVDMAGWTAVIDALRTGIISPPEISKYASQAKRDTNKALLNPSDIVITFQKSDVLDSDSGTTSEVVSRADLVTLMFTLNELYSTSMSKTQHLLSSVIGHMRPDSLLLVVDSPGSYSTVAINGTEKKYPMQWLLDFTLRGSSRNRDEAGVCWEQVLSDDSRWFRLPEGLQYPIELENMRYQIHLYRKLR